VDELFKHHLNFAGDSYIPYVLQNRPAYLPEYSRHPSQAVHSFEYEGGFIYINKL
jgi:hypothetical protein